MIRFNPTKQFMVCWFIHFLKHYKSRNFLLQEYSKFLVFWEGFYTVQPHLLNWFEFNFILICTFASWSWLHPWPSLAYSPMCTPVSCFHSLLSIFTQFIFTHVHFSHLYLISVSSECNFCFFPPLCYVLFHFFFVAILSWGVDLGLIYWLFRKELFRIIYLFRIQFISTCLQDQDLQRWVNIFMLMES